MTSIYVQSHGIPEQTLTLIPTQNIQSQKTITVSEKASVQNNEQYIKEIENLRKQIKMLEIKQDVIEAEKEELANQVWDLKALMKRLALEGERNLRREEERGKLLSSKVSSLEKALEYSYEYAGHFDQMAEFWKLMD